MSDSASYGLVDFGDRRRLERFADVVVDRPAPAATSPRQDPAAWTHATARFADGRWHVAAPLPEPWLVRADGLTLELAATDTGQVGWFPEHAALWPWLTGQVRPDDEVLHLFAYTGATTLVLARAGARVAHLDASRPAVGWARRNADRNDLAERTVRWLVDDAPRFVDREIRRGRRYAGIVLDPPSYGHGPGGQAWRLGTDLDRLLRACATLARPEAFVLLTAHTPGEDGSVLGTRLSRAFPDAHRRLEHGELTLESERGTVLRLGAWAAIMAG
jgi:23S rRNA (cytosine1962-C5)-methyltransferase